MIHKCTNGPSYAIEFLGLIREYFRSLVGAEVRLIKMIKVHC